MIKVNLLKNDIGTDQAEAFGDILACHPTLKSLCGLDPGATEADFSNQGLKSDDAILLAHSVKFNSGMISLNVANNNLGAEGAKHIAEGINAHP